MCSELGKRHARIRQEPHHLHLCGAAQSGTQGHSAAPPQQCLWPSRAWITHVSWPFSPCSLSPTQGRILPELQLTRVSGLQTVAGPELHTASSRSLARSSGTPALECTLRVRGQGKARQAGERSGCCSCSQLAQGREKGKRHQKPGQTKPDTILHQRSSCTGQNHLTGRILPTPGIGPYSSMV